MGQGGVARRALRPGRISWQAVLVFVQLTPNEDIALVCAPGGPVARLLGDACCPRRGQALMARLVKRALEEEQHALVEAGTGS